MIHITVPGQGEIALPDELLQNLRRVHGGRADEWLTGLDALLAEVLDSLDARVMPGTPPLSYHLVFFARRAGDEDIVIKCTVPNDEQIPEAAAVRTLSDAGIGPRLLWSDLDRGVLVMERVRPGGIMPTGMPTRAEDAATTRQIASLADRMAHGADVRTWRGDLVPVRQYTRALEQEIPCSSLWRQHRDSIEHAVNLRDAMLDAPDGLDVFVHGDLHHYNILQDQRQGLRVIDPKGLVGPPGYEFGALTYNPVGIQRHPDFAAIIRQRVMVWSETTGLPWETVRAWGYVAAMLSACWSAEDLGEGWQNAMNVALTLRDLQSASSTLR